MSEERRIAILLHGPSAVGKSAVAEALCQKLKLPCRAIRPPLDKGWLCGEQRHSTDPYGDQRCRDQRIVILELGGGEPAVLGPAGKGATQNPQAWMKVVCEDCRRRLFVFRLSARWATIQQRCERRGQSDLVSVWEWFDRYSRSDALVTFPDSAGIAEAEIQTDERTEDEVAAEIITHLKDQNALEA
jgi:hypothetical protein